VKRLLPALVVLLPFAGSAAFGADDCIEFGKPKPQQNFAYRRTDSNGAKSDYSQRWTEFLPERTTVTVARGASGETVVSLQTLSDDVTLIASTTSTSRSGSSRTSFQPAVMGDPMRRACAGRSWTIPAVSATHSEGDRVNSAQTYAGTMRIIALRETIRVPAGEFPCVHYTRTLATPGGQSVDNYWKSIEHGVMVRQVSKLGNWSSTQELVAIR
jgi:hypothetical protein